MIFILPVFITSRRELFHLVRIPLLLITITTSFDRSWQQLGDYSQDLMGNSRLHVDNDDKAALNANIVVRIHIERVLTRRLAPPRRVGHVRKRCIFPRYRVPGELLYTQIRRRAFNAQGQQHLRRYALYRTHVSHPHTCAIIDRLVRRDYIFSL